MKGLMVSIGWYNWGLVGASRRVLAESFGLAEARACSSELVKFISRASQSGSTALLGPHASNPKMWHGVLAHLNSASSILAALAPDHRKGPATSTSR